MFFSGFSSVIYSILSFVRVGVGMMMIMYKEDDDSGRAGIPFMSGPFFITMVNSFSEIYSSIGFVFYVNIYNIDICMRVRRMMTGGLDE